MFVVYFNCELACTFTFFPYQINVMISFKPLVYLNFTCYNILDSYSIGFEYN